MGSHDAARPLFVLARRRTGAGEVFRMLSSHVGRPSAGADPFLPGHPFHAITRAFEDGRLWEMRRLMQQLLAEGPFFRLHWDVEPSDLCEPLFECLAQAGYRAIVFDREDEAERLYSLAVCQHFEAWDAAAIEELRKRARDGEALVGPSIEAGRALVQTETARRRWFDRVFPAANIESTTFTYEALYRRGTAVLGEMDRLFSFAGLPDRAACMSDDSLLRFVFLRGHYTLGLAQYSPALRELYEAIGIALQQPLES